MLIRKALGLGLIAGALGSVAIAQGCGDSSPAGSTYPSPPDGGPDILVTHDPDLEGGVSGLLGAGCANARAQAARIPVYMLIVLDGSGSMDTNPDGSPSQKWASVRAALDTIFDDFKNQGDTGFGVGFTIFADQNDPTISDFNAGPYNKMDVPIAFVDGAQHNKLHARLDLTKPNLGTPTFEVLSGQYPLLEQFQASGQLLPGGKRVIVFVTDGIPDPDMPAGQMEAPLSLKLAQSEATKAAPEGPITLFAVGVGELALDAGGPSYDPKFMGALALAGGEPNTPCDPNETTDPSKMCHFQITPGAKPVAQLAKEFIDTINKIRTRLLSCEYKLDRTGGNIDPNHVNVIYTDGSGAQFILPLNLGNGWTYDDATNPTKVILHGSTCDKVKSDAKGKIEIVLGCRTILK